MAIAVEPQIYQRFRGIREYNGVNGGGEISAIVANNVELVQTEIGSAVGIKSVEGNTVAYTLPAGYNILGIWGSMQENVTYKFIYAENEEKGALFYINLVNEAEIVVDNLTKTGQCNAITMSVGAFDVFVFTNGEEAKTVCFTGDSAYGEQVKTITAKDYLGRTIKWLSMTEWNGFLVVASQYGVHSSHQSDIYTWNENPVDIADAWYIDFSKRVTAVFGFTGGLYIFTSDDCTFLNTTPNDTANSQMKTSAGVGCYSHTSIVNHDLYLFFYDNNQKNIYYLSATDTTGQIKPSGPVAKEIQSYFKKIDKFSMKSCIYNTRNEIWCLINDNILIYDYAQQEWLTRQEQDVATVAMIQNKVYTGGNTGKVYIENINVDFSGQFFPCVYQTTFINLGSNSNLKKQKTPLLLVLDDNYTNDFWVELTCNAKPKEPKRVRVVSRKSGVYAYDIEEGLIPANQKFGTAKYAAENAYAKKVVEISTPQTWYTLGIKIYTKEMGQGFYIYSMELKNTKIKTKTRGR